jgi:predicted enzyme related to lactoylglutathione lyase
MTIHVVIDCTNPKALAEFWAAALDYDRLADLDNYSVIVDKKRLAGATGDLGPTVILQKVPEQKAVKNRVHLDVVAEDVDAEVARLETLGATRAPEGAFEEHGISWVQMRDPEDNEFCVCQGFGL